MLVDKVSKGKITSITAMSTLSLANRRNDRAVKTYIDNINDCQMSYKENIHNTINLKKKQIYVNIINQNKQIYMYI